MRQFGQLPRITPIPHGSHVDCSASLTKLTALQAPTAMLSVCVYTRSGWNGGSSDIDAGTGFVGAFTHALNLLEPSRPYRVCYGTPLSFQKLVYISNEQIHVSTKHVDIFRDVKHKR